MFYNTHKRMFRTIEFRRSIHSKKHFQSHVNNYFTLYIEYIMKMYASNYLVIFGKLITFCIMESLKAFSCFDHSSWHVLFIVCKGSMAVICQRDAVKLWPQFSAPTPVIWESWTWVPMICRIQEWSCSLLDWGVHTVHWKFSGQITQCANSYK